MSSSLVKSLKFHYLNNRETENLFFSDDEDNDFNFKYVPASQFKYIVKDVKRQRTKRDEEHIWDTFIHQQEQKRSSDYHVDCFHGVANAKELLRDNLEEIDEELKRLEEDALPEQTKRLNDCGIPKLAKRQQDNLVQKNNVKPPSNINYPLEKDDAPGNSNTLITIPEEDRRLVTLERSPISQLNLTAKANTSRYEHTIKNQIERPYIHKLNCRECNSNPEFTSPNDSDDYHEIQEIRPNPIVAHKILGIQTKISELLDEIFYRLCRIPKPDGDIDLKRRQQRVMEFSIRFSRNYLYELGRQVVNIERHLNAISPNARIKPTTRGTALHMQALQQKLCSAHQLLLNALSAYCKHIPSSILKGHPGKLNDILQIVIHIKDICTRINLTTEYFGAGDIAPPPLGKDTQKRCYAILSKLRLNSDNESPLFSHSTQSTLVGVSTIGDIKRRRNQLDSRKSLPNRFNMYNVDSRHNKSQKHRRPVTVGVYLKEKRPVIERLPLSNPPPTPDKPHPSLATMRSEKKLIKRTRMRARAYQKEDEIRTMMDFMPIDSEAGSNALLARTGHSSLSNSTKIMRKSKSKQWQRDENSPPMIKSNNQSFNHVNDDDRSTKGVTITDEHLSSLIPVIADIMTLISNKQNNTETELGSTSMETFLEGLHEYLLSKNRGNNYESIATSTAKHQENSDRKFVESPSAPEIEQLNMSLHEKENPPVPNHSESSIHSRRDNSKHIENKDCKLTKLIVSDASAEELLNYRNELSNYQRSCRSSPMYTSSSLNKPWEVIAWIADKLVDELIVEISKELQMDDVIQKMFDLEFQEF